MKYVCQQVQVKKDNDARMMGLSAAVSSSFQTQQGAMFMQHITNNISYLIVLKKITVFSTDAVLLGIGLDLLLFWDDHCHHKTLHCTHVNYSLRVYW